MTDPVAVPVVHSITDLLLAQGVLGVVTLVLAYAVWILYRQNQVLHEKRLEDFKTMNDRYHQDVVETNRTIEALGRSVEEKKK